MKSDEMFEEFRLWFKANEEKLKREPLAAKIRRSEIEDETLTPPLYAAGVDLKTEDILASFGVWGNGDLQVIIVNNKTGEHLVVDDRRLDKPSQIHPVLDHYCKLIVNGGQFEKYPEF